MTSSSYLKAARGETLDVPPVWMMRQAGRYLPEYLEVRKGHDFLEVCRTPELACEVTLQPIRRFGFDAAILFSDILVPLVHMGADLSFASDHGPIIGNPVRSRADVDALREIDPRVDLDYVLEAIRLIRARLPDDVALIGFIGAPFTLSAYLIEGGKPAPFSHLRQMMYGDRPTFLRLLDRLGRMSAQYLEAMVEAGADAVQVFDTWAGTLSELEFREVNLPVLQHIFGHLAPLHVPMTYFALGGRHLLPAVRETGCTVAGLDYNTPITEARGVLGDGIALQGNLDPSVLLRDEPSIRREVRRVLEQGASRGHIFNLGHGILRTTPVRSVEIMLDEVRRRVA